MIFTALLLFSVLIRRRKFRTFSHFVCVQKTRKLKFFFAKFRFNQFREKCQFLSKSNMRAFRYKNGREIIDYDIIKLLMLNFRSRESTSFFSAINCCSYKICFREIYFCEIRTNIFAFFRESFRSLETLAHMSIYLFVNLYI